MQVPKCSGGRVPNPLAMLASGLSACILAAAAAAQSPTVVSPTSPVPTQPPTTTLPPPVVNVSPQVIVGRWSYTRSDTETRSSDTVTIEFMSDGRYQAKNRNSHLATPEKPSQGRYVIANLQGNSFDLRIERNLADPESDPRDAVEVQRITVIDSNTLQAADGSVVRRM